MDNQITNADKAQLMDRFLDVCLKCGISKLQNITQAEYAALFNQAIEALSDNDYKLIRRTT